MELLKPKIDVVFHSLFREENKRLTEGLISDILGEKVKVITTAKDRHIDRPARNSYNRDTKGEENIQTK